MFDLFLISLFIQNIVIHDTQIHHVENNKQYNAKILYIVQYSYKNMIKLDVGIMFIRKLGTLLETSVYVDTTILFFESKILQSFITQYTSVFNKDL